MVNITQINKVFYDEIFARMYDATHPRMYPSNYANRLFAGILSEIIPSIRSESCEVLDIGSGTGGYARTIIERFPHTLLDANDVSIEMLKMFAAKLSTPEVQSRFTPLCMDVSAALATGKRYHCICVEETLHHLEDYLAIVAMSCDALYPSGYLVIFNEPFSMPKRG